MGRYLLLLDGMQSKLKAVLALHDAYLILSLKDITGICRIRVFSKSLKPLAILSYHNESIYALAFSTILSNEDIDKHYLVGAGKDKRISLWEIY